MSSGEDIFGPLLRKFFLNNSHRVTVELLPDSKLGSEKEQAEKDRLKSYQSELTSEDVAKTIAKTKELRDRQVRLSISSVLYVIIRCRTAIPASMRFMHLLCLVLSICLAN